MSQDDLAREMAERGWQYYQSTVYKIEKGERKVDFWEATDLAEILKTSVDRFRWTSAEANETAMVRSAAANLRGRWREAGHAVASYLAARTLAERTLATSGKSRSPRVIAACRELELDLGQYGGIDDAVDQGVADYEAREESGT